jgi:UDPglucose 6-dehydrogenase
MLRAAFAPILEAGTPVVVADFATAELVKVAANSFLATKISFINAMAEVCEAVGGDVTLLSKALSYDTRIGGRFLVPGLGFGGGCLPKDIRAFVARTEELGIGDAVRFLVEVDNINLRRRARVITLAEELLGPHLASSKVTVLGAAFKPNSDDIRDSPALDIAQRFHELGATVVVHDPEAIVNARRARPALGYAETVLEAAAGADLVVLATEWEQYRSLDPVSLASVTARQQVIDCRNALDADAWRAGGWHYRALGRP